MLVHGSAVLNEATLTGESVPQMKEGVLASKDGGDEVSFCAHTRQVVWQHVCRSCTLSRFGCDLDLEDLDLEEGEEGLGHLLSCRTA